MRLINADKLKSDMKIFTSAYSTELTECYSLKAIDNAPTIEAEPVKHGEWIKTPNGVKKDINTGKMVVSYKCECNICGFCTGNQGLKFKYCPNCSAKMDGGQTT